VEPEKSLRDAGFEGDLDSNALLAPLTTWKIGGPAELLASPATESDLALAISWALEHGIPWRILGNGSNLLVSDQGVQGLVVRIRKVLDAVVFNGPTVRAGAGASFPLLANQCATEGLAGLEFASGIPGTVGGAIIMNAGWHEFEIGRFVDEVRFLTPQGDIETCSRSDCRFTYRSSAFRHRPGVVLEAALTLREGEREEIESRLLGFVASRKQNQPTHLPSCGSVFEQPPGDFAGRLIEAAGLKGTRIGDVQVSPLHANFFVNLGQGTSRDVLTLVRQVEEAILNRFQVQLVREFEYWGDKSSRSAPGPDR
jgi:UDP-N-acetylmuramate dehydrogenase